VYRVHERFQAQSFIAQGILFRHERALVPVVAVRQAAGYVHTTPSCHSGFTKNTDKLNKVRLGVQGTQSSHFDPKF